MKLNKLTIALIMAVAGFAGSAQASPITVDGITWDPSSILDFTSHTNLYEMTTGVAGDQISGYGNITAVNGLSNFASPGTELTYQFGGYTLLPAARHTVGDPYYQATETGINSLTGQFAFSGGWLKVYVDHAANFNYLVKSTAGEGGVWLDLTGASGIYPAGVTLAGGLTAPNSNGLTGTGTGYFDVVGGEAAANMNTNSQPGGTDFTYTSSFQPIGSDIINTIGGDVSMAVANAYGDNTIHGHSISIPEPASIALLGLGLLGLGMSRRNKKAA